MPRVIAALVAAVVLCLPAAAGASVRLAFHYPWYPESYEQGTHYTPNLVPTWPYDSGAQDVIDAQIQSMRYARLQGAIASWWGQGTRTDSRIPAMLDRAQALSPGDTGFKWTLYYEREGSVTSDPDDPNPPVSRLVSDLNYIAERYASHPSYLRVDGKPVIFAYGDSSDICATASRWEQANAQASIQFHVVLKVFSGYATCADQPDSWHQYGPAVRVSTHGTHHMNISPGFWAFYESAPRLARSESEYAAAMQRLAAFTGRWQLITSWNEWGEGTGIERAAGWDQTENGAYADITRRDGQPEGTEPPAQCADGLDNDFDGTQDLIDSDCATAADTLEAPDPVEPPPPDPVPDTTAPSSPGNLQQGGPAVGDPQTQIRVVWDASTDDVAVASYWVERNGVHVDTRPADSLTHASSGLACGTSYTFAVTAIDAAGNRSEPATVTAATAACTDTSGEPSPSDPVFTVAGDIACDPTMSVFNGGTGTASNCHQMATSDLLAGSTAVAALGDNQYENATYDKFMQSFDPSWGRYKQILYPVIGNHEYSGGSNYPAANGTGYCQYFGVRANCGTSNATRAYYAFDVGAWRVYALNSNCGRASGGCGTDSPQNQWLDRDMTDNPRRCSIMLTHHPRWSSGQHGDNAGLSNMGALDDTFYAHGGDIMLAGHDHDYERFARKRPDGTVASNGMRSFVVGTGGKNHYGFGTPHPGSEVRNSDTYGVLKLTLHPNSYAWRFVPEPGKTFTDASPAAESCR